jgi:hypothetical protein
MWDDFHTRHQDWEQVICFSLGYFLLDLIQISVVKPTPSDYYESVIHHLINLYVHFVPVCIYHGYVQLSMVGCKSSARCGRACAAITHSCCGSKLLIGAARTQTSLS